MVRINKDFINKVIEKLIKGIMQLIALIKNIYLLCKYLVKQIYTYIMFFINFIIYINQKYMGNKHWSFYVYSLYYFGMFFASVIHHNVLYVTYGITALDLFFGDIVYLCIFCLCIYSIESDDEALKWVMVFALASAFLTTIYLVGLVFAKSFFFKISLLIINSIFIILLVRYLLN
jgi:hypothetical protein